MKFFSRTSSALLFLVTALVILGTVRTLNFKRPEITSKNTSVLSDVSIDRNQIAERVSEAIRFKTLTPTYEQDADIQPFLDFHAWLKFTYPLVFEKVKLEETETASLLITLEGTDPLLAPLLLLAHQDVVPVVQENWSHLPFAGDISEGFVWGRGSVDDKGMIVCMMEALNLIIQSDLTPQRTIILALGHDEESRGTGAASMSAMLKNRNIIPFSILDEGYPVFTDFPLTDGIVALVGVAEKGYLTLKITAKGEAGHSSTPPTQTAVTTLARALIELQKMPIKQKADDTIGSMFLYVADELPFLQKFVVANRDILGGVLVGALSESNGSRALLGTTTAPTILSASKAENVLPESAFALVNIRLHPRDTVASILRKATNQLKKIDGVSVEVHTDSGEEAVASASLGEKFERVRAAFESLDSQIPVTPGLMIAATDSKKYSDITQDIYRTTPIQVSQQEYSRIHNDDERISIENLEFATRFYLAYMTMQ